MTPLITDDFDDDLLGSGGEEDEDVVELTPMAH
jgi:hypothetical protein